jgi:hypothetical protein
MANRRFIDFPVATTVGANDIILIWQDGLNKQTTKATILSGLPEDLEDLADVNISGLTNGQILRYDSTTGKWVNTDQGNLNLDDLNDVSIVSPSNGQVLVYNSSTSKWENSSGGFVPYVGAVTTVDLGAQGLGAGYVRFNTSVVSVPDEQGIMYWDADNETVDVILNGTIMQIGQDLFYPVKNQTGSTIAKGTAVRFAGTVGNSGRLLIAPFIADNTVPSSRFMGVTSEEILDGADGKVMWFGRIRGINTDAFNEGDVLYASTTTAGAFQTTIPVAPNNIVQVAAVVTKSINQGAIFVRPTIGSNINKDEGVKITSVADKDLLQYQSGTALWENKAVATVMSNYVTLDTGQTITGQKFFANNTLTLNTTGNANSTILTNSIGASTYQSGRNFFGFNTDNHIYFAKSSNTGVNTGIFAWANTATRTYTLKDASGTLAFTSDIPANPVGGTGTTNYLPKFTGASTIGNSQVFDNGTNVGIGTASPKAILSSANTGALTLNSNDGNHTGFGLFIQAPSTINTVNSAIGFGQTSGRKLAAIGMQTYGDADQAGLNFYVQPTASGSAATLTEAMRITSGGNVGIGTATPATKLHISGAGAQTLRIENTNTAIVLNNIIGSIVFQSNDASVGGTGVAGSINSISEAASGVNYGLGFNTKTFATELERMRITAGGNVLIGTTTDAGFKLDVNGTGRFSGALRISNNASNGVVGTNFQAFAVSPNSFFRLGNNVNNSLNIQLTRSDSATMFSVDGHNGNCFVASLGTGIVYSNGGTLTSTNPSDERLKDNIENIGWGLEEILKLRPVSYTWKNDTINQGKQYGFIAQEVQKIMPDLVKQGEYLGLDKEAIFTTLVKAIQELKQEIDTLKN